MSETENYIVNYETEQFRNFITKILTFAKLPQKYIEAIEDLIKANITIISTGPDRNQTIDKNNYLDSV